MRRGGESMQQRTVLVAAIALLLCTSVPVEGQFNNVLSALFGGTTPAATPAATTAAATTATPAATTAAATDATPAATSAATTDSTPAATTAAATTTTPAATTAAAATTTTATPAATTAAVAAAPAAATAVAAAPAAATPKATPAVAKATPTATVKATPAPTKKAIPSPPPPVPITINPALLVPALPADQTAQAPAAASPAAASGGSNSSQTAVDVVIQVSGSGVTPFVVPQQTILLRAMASVLTTVSLGDLSIRYVTSAVNQRRRLLADDLPHQVRRSLLANDTAQAAAAASGQLYNQASVTLQANCSSSAAVPATLTEIQSVLSNNLLASAVQAYGAPTWGVSMLSLTSVDPNARLSTGPKCKKPLGSLCLDGTSLTVAATEVIIAFGSVVVIMLLAIPCVVLEWRRKSGRMAELEPTPETPRTPLEKVQQFYNNLVEKAKAASPLHRRGASNGRNAFKPDTPTSAKAGGNTVQLTATSRS